MRFERKIVFVFIIAWSLSEDVHGQYHGWPLYPSNTQKIVTGTFGEVRGDNTRDHVHSGIDVDVTGTNTKVISVQQGNVSNIAASTITTRKYVFDGSIGAWVWRYYTYIHVDNIQVVEFQSINIGTILGYTNTSGSNHLHFVNGHYEVLNATLEDPLAYLDPFVDYENPVIETFKVGVILNEDTTNYREDLWFGLASASQGDTLDVIVQAYDISGTIGGNNNGVNWVRVTIKNPIGATIHTASSIDFLYAPNGRAGWDVDIIYANGSRHADNGVPAGVYIYKGTNGLKTDGYWVVPDNADEGIYTITVIVEDIYGNTDTEILSFYIAGSPKAELSAFKK